MDFCFSTEAVDLDRQMPNRNKRESKYYWDELYRLIAAGGFRSIEISYEPKWDFGGRSGIPRTARSIRIKFGTAERYLSYLREQGIDAVGCVHFDPALFCQGEAPMYFGAAAHFGAEAAGFAAGLGCKALSVSATPPVFAVRKLAGGLTEEAFLEKTAELISSLAEEAEARGVRLCLKNDYWGLLRGEAVTAFLDRFGGKVLLDLDTAHLSAAGADPRSLLQANRDRLGIVHLTDTAFTDRDGTWETALPEFPAQRPTKVFRDPGEGMLDLKGALDAAKAAGYGGTVVLNPRNSCDVYRSILRCRYFADHVLSV